jgi:hypothetical protein
VSGVRMILGDLLGFLRHIGNMSAADVQVGG